METYSNLYKKTIGIVYDVPQQLKQSKFFQLPHDATSEWESEETIEILKETWKALGFNIILFPLDQNFLTHWASKIHYCDVIHSIAEGFGSLAREAWIPSLCELSGIPCIGSNPFAHTLCMSKTHVKMICRKFKIPIAKSYFIRSLNSIKNIPNDFFSNPHFIKPDGEGSGMGVDAKHSISSEKINTVKIISELLNLYPDGVLIEKYLPGDEYTTAIIGLEKEFLPIAKIEVPDGVYGFLNKSKSYLSEKVTFPLLSLNIQKDLKKYSRNIFSYFNMCDFSRFDWKCDENGKAFFLESNTLPGLSKIYSVLPLMAKEAGIEYEAFLLMLFESAMKRYHHRNLWYGQTRLRNLSI